MIFVVIFFLKKKKKEKKRHQASREFSLPFFFFTYFFSFYFISTWSSLRGVRLWMYENMYFWNLFCIPRVEQGYYQNQRDRYDAPVKEAGTVERASWQRLSYTKDSLRSWLERRERSSMGGILPRT